MLSKCAKVATHLKPYGYITSITKYRGTAESCKSGPKNSKKDEPASASTCQSSTSRADGSKTCQLCRTKIHSRRARAPPKLPLFGPPGRSQRRAALLAVSCLGYSMPPRRKFAINHGRCRQRFWRRHHTAMTTLFCSALRLALRYSKLWSARYFVQGTILIGSVDGIGSRRMSKPKLLCCSR